MSDDLVTRFPAEKGVAVLYSTSETIAKGLRVYTAAELW